MSLTAAHQRAILSAAIELAKKRIRLAEMEKAASASGVDPGEGLRMVLQAGMDVDHAVTEVTNAVIDANIAHVAEGN